MSWFGRFFRWLGGLFGGDTILCDTCKYDYPAACNNPERPNATKCKDYKHK